MRRAQRYARARALLPAEGPSALLGPVLAPVFATRAATLALEWAGAGDRFRFQERRADGTFARLADPAAGTVRDDAAGAAPATRPGPRTSPDARYAVTGRLLLDGVRRWPVVDSSTPPGHPPRVAFTPFPLAGDAALPRVELAVVERATGRSVPVAAEPLDAFWHPLDPFTGLVWWDRHGRLLALREARWNRRVALEQIDPATGVVRTVYESRSTTHRLPAAERFPPAHGFWLLGDGEGVIAWSREEDGHGHLFLHADGRVRALTRGRWEVGRILHVDEEAGAVWCSGRGREPGVDPYHALLYRVGLDGGAPELLTRDGLHHELVALPSGHGFVDTAGAIAPPLTTSVRGRDGGVLLEVGITTPRGPARPVERTRVTARDGRTELAAVVYRPADYDRRARYPVLLHQYGVPSRIHGCVTYAGSEDFWTCTALAELGFVVLQVDGMGTPLRGRAFHDASYAGGFADASGLEDWVLALRQLAARDPSMDLDRVGVVGYSGGGYGAARAVLARPDVFHVAVAAGGNHDQRLCGPACGERWLGPPDEHPQAWEAQANVGLADRLRGRLLLIHGETDTDVPLANTLQLVAACIAADRDVDLLVVPGADHAACKHHPYVIRRTWDYLVEHLIERPRRR